MRLRSFWAGVEGRCQRELETRERINHDSRGFESSDFAKDEHQYLVDTDIRLPRVHQPHRPVRNQIGEHSIARSTRMLLKRRDNAGFTTARTFSEKRGGQDAFSRT